MLFDQLKELGILGINKRIGEFIIPNNPRKYYPLVDDKVLTAKKCLEWNIPMPFNEIVIERHGDLTNLPQLLSDLNSFVIKPANGSQGNGIIVISKIEKDADGKLIFTRSNGKEISLADIRHHLSGILSGLYSLSGQPDLAIIQEKIEIHPAFNHYAYQGIPDIRVIVFNGYPVMSMIRLPTKSSNGRANLHQGAIGAGISLKTGTTINAVINNQITNIHPDTHYPLIGLKIPFWDEILILAAKCFDMVPLGYLGVDIVITEKKGPILLELNARPGLGIQIANLAGLVPRLKTIEANLNVTRDASQRVLLSQQLF
jgi:alpha-L-glutamate ligase-like protein